MTRSILLFVSMVLMFTGSAIAGGIEVSDASIRATAPGMTATGGYLTIANHGDSDDRLISASAEFAGRVELHEMIMDGDVMKMREREDGIAVPAGGMAMLKPGGLHLMLMGLTETMRPGERRFVTLTFQSGHSVTVPAMVMKPGDIGGASHRHEHKHKHKHKHGAADHN